MASAQGWNHAAYGGGVHHTSNPTSAVVNKVVAGGNELFVAGVFNSVNPASPNVARFNSFGQASVLGSGITAQVTALARSSTGTLYAADWNGTNAVVRLFNGTMWIPVGAAFNAQIRSLVLQGTTVVAAGNFTTPQLGVAQFGGGVWQALGGGMMAVTSMNSLDVDTSGNVFAGGLFYPAGFAAPTNLAVFNGTAWTTFAGGAAPAGTIDVVRLGLDGTVVTAHQSPFSVNLGSGSGWVTVATSLSAGGVVKDVLGLPFGEVVICGSFSTVDSVSAACVARFNGSSWSALATSVTALSGVTPSINSMAIKNTRIAMGGNFNAIGTAATRLIDRLPEVSGTSADIPSTGCHAPSIFPFPVLLTSDMPLIGTQFDSLVQHLPATSSLFHVIGFSMVSPPIKLDTLGINGDPDCELNITQDLVIGPADFTGQPAPVFVPPLFMNVGDSLLQQIIVFDTTATPGFTRSSQAMVFTYGKL